jgi:acetyltransferase-like isoleucine patch superfamily enzyme
VTSGEKQMLVWNDIEADKIRNRTTAQSSPRVVPMLESDKSPGEEEGVRAMNDFSCIAADVKFGKDVRLSKFINLYGCEIGDGTKIGAFVEIQKAASVGKNCKIGSHSFICEGVTIEDNVFVGHGVTFINDSYPRATTSDGRLQTEKDWKVERTLIKKGASIGSGAIILSKITIGENAIVGAGSVVTKDVPAGTIVAGNPAKALRQISEELGTGRNAVK